MEQKVFYNAKFYTFSDQSPVAEALFVSEKTIVFAGKKEEVFKLAGTDCEKIDLGGTVVFPSFFDANINLFRMIADKTKTAKSGNIIKKTAKKSSINEDLYNYNDYVDELKKIQKACISGGITTIFEKDIGEEEFEFWKKVSEQNILDIDVIGFVDFKNNKSIMDENCRTFRKYKNRFRLGGYTVALDGNLHTGGAWIKSPYKKSLGYNGCARVTDEELCYIIKTAISEKKQLMVSASGEMSVAQFLRCYEQVQNLENFEDNYRICLTDVGLITKKQIELCRKYKIGLSLNFEYIKAHETELKKVLGKIRARRLLPLCVLKKQNIDFMLESEKNNFLNLVDALGDVTSKDKKMTANDAILSLTKNLSYFAFDDNLKGTLESGKLANFVVVDFDPFESKFQTGAYLNIKDVYIEAESKI